MKFQVQGFERHRVGKEPELRLHNLPDKSAFYAGYGSGRTTWMNFLSKNYIELINDITYCFLYFNM